MASYYLMASFWGSSRDTLDGYLDGIFEGDFDDDLLGLLGRIWVNSGKFFDGDLLGLFE
jgi:hypothetical protein